MSNFLEKLKKGMEIEINEKIEESEKKPKEKEEAKREVRGTKETKKTCLPAGREKPAESKIIQKAKKNPAEEKCPELKIKKIEIQTSDEPNKKESFLKERKWSFKEKGEGELAIDIYQTANDLVIQSAIAGVAPEDLDIAIEKDILTIRGKRERPNQENSDYFTQECFWGVFSKEIILPVEVDPGRINAEMKNGILIIRMPKIFRENKKRIEIKK
jgi:HSP20 family protein